MRKLDFLSFTYKSLWCADMMLMIGRNCAKRSNPNRHPILTETGNEETEESGRCIPTASNLQLVKKKRSHTDFTEPSAVVPCKKKLFSSRPRSIEVEDIVNDSNNVDEEDGVDEIDYGKSIENDVEHEPLENEQNDEHFSDINSKELTQNSNCKHLLSQIPATEKKKWPQKRCVYCRKYGTRRDTRYICSSCNIALCKSPCFSEYHSCK